MPEPRACEARSRPGSRGVVAAVAKGIAAATKKRVGGRDSRYLLGSILKCGCCGANMIGDGRTDYICPGYSSGACANDLRTRREPVHQAVFDVLKDHLLSPAALAAGEQYVQAVLREREREEAAAARAAADGKPVKRIDANIAALQALDLPDDVKSMAIAKLEAQRAEIVAGVQPAVGKRAVTAAQLVARMPQIASAYCTAVENAMKVLTDVKAVALAREGVRKLLVDGCIVVTPDAEHAALTGTVRFKELGEHVLETAGIRRKIEHLEQKEGVEVTQKVSLVAGA
jgi:Recombinase zinc beta ribbon domain